jgi:endoglucanase
VTIALLSRQSEPPRPDEHAPRAAREFLERYVAADGRVVRLDQGGDTVSEGQSYGLLIAQVARDEAGFRRIWRWTKAHLQRPDGLFASRADAHGAIDQNPASDGDLVVAWALSRAHGPGASAYHREARRIASAVLEHETVVRGGRWMLAAGPWATGSPVTLNPSYWAFGAFGALAKATGDRRWRRLSADSLALTRALSDDGRELPPDWARVDGTAATRTPAPNGQPAAVQYGPDAQRTLVWLAAGCHHAGRRLAAAWWPKLSSPARARALALGPDGTVLNPGPHPLALVAAAAAADAAGQGRDRDRLLGEAARENEARPSYFGHAWVVLGRALLTTRVLGGCASGGGAR